MHAKICIAMKYFLLHPLSAPVYVANMLDWLVNYGTSLLRMRKFLR